MWVAQEVGEIGSCWLAVNLLQALLALPRMLVPGMARASELVWLLSEVWEDRMRLVSFVRR
jgi:hypothetical protein